jgi:hypothetical protein
MALGTAYGGSVTTIVENNFTTNINGKATLLTDLDLGSSGIIKGDFIAADTVAKGDACYINASGQCKIADASAASTCDGVIVIANEAITATNSGEFMLYGIMDGFVGLTAGSHYWISTTGTTGNTNTTTKPSTTGEIQKRLGTAISTTEIFFDPAQDYGEVP